MPLALIPFFLLVMPLLEITVFILVGGAIGLWPTLGLVLLSAVVGAALLKRQGTATITQIRREIEAGRLPGRDLVHGVMIIVAGVLLLSPGFVTDAIGLLLFVPAFRELGWRFLKSRVVVVASGRAGRPRPAPDFPHRRPDVVDLGEDDFRRKPDPNSPWHGTTQDDPGNRTLH